MNEKPELPRPVAEIPRAPLWCSLVIPPVMTVLGNIVASFARDKESLSFGLFPVMFFVILGFAFRFHHLVSKRYRGSSLVFLNIAYFLGQIIVCIALWFGSCLLFFSR